MSAAHELPVLVDVADACRVLGLSPAQVRRLVDRGELVGYRFGRRVRIEEGEREAALRARVEAALVAARGRVGRAADALGWTTAALEALLVEHPHWWPREELGPRGG